MGFEKQNINWDGSIFLLSFSEGNIFLLLVLLSYFFLDLFPVYNPLEHILSQINQRALGHSLNRRLPWGII